MKIEQWKNDEYICTTDKTKLQTDTIHDFLNNRSYWAKGRTEQEVKRSIEHSECFGLFKGNL